MTGIPDFRLNHSMRMIRCFCRYLADRFFIIVCFNINDCIRDLLVVFSDCFVKDIGHDKCVFYTENICFDFRTSLSEMPFFIGNFSTIIK